MDAERRLSAIRRRLIAAAIAATLAISGLALPAGTAEATPDGTASAAPSGRDGRDPADRDGLQRGLDQLVDTGAVGAVAEVRDGAWTWRGSSGTGRLGSTRPVPERSRFRAGSITKTFVATVVLQLVAEHRLALTDSVEHWLPGVVPDGDRITVRELLNQTSGIPDYLDTLPLPPAAGFLRIRSRTWTASELINRATARPAGQPGKSFSYSNTNYLLLGEIIERVTGHSYAREIDRRIIEPLGLVGTSLPGSSERIPGPHPDGYVPIEQNGQSRLVDNTRMNPSVMGASGELISTTADLNGFYRALLGGRLLPRRLLGLMITAGVPGSPYGMGMFMINTSCGVRLYGHDGDALSYQSWSYSTLDGRRQLTVALTPDFRKDLDDDVSSYLDTVFCS